MNEQNISGDVVINMLSLNNSELIGTSSERLVGHLRSADFFEVENYPNATLNFKSKSYNKLKNLIDFEGQLTIKDISNPIFFSAFLASVKFLAISALGHSKPIFVMAL